MKLTNIVYLVGSGEKGVHLTDAFDCHVYLIDGGDELALIDAGAGFGVEQIIEVIKQDGFSIDKLKYLILTHAHADHAGGAKKLKEMTGVDIIASPLAADFLENGNEKAINLSLAKEAGFYPLDYEFEPCPVKYIVHEGEQIKVGNLKLNVLETPGHCRGHLSFYMETPGRNYLFGGDLVFYEGKVATQFIDDCNIFDLGNSLKRLENMKVDVLLPGHETFVLKEGSKHIDNAIASIKRLAIPSSIIY